MKSRLKSKTHWTAMAVTALGAVETNAPMLREYLGDWYGLTYVGIGITMAVLREVTSEPVG